MHAPPVSHEHARRSAIARRARRSMAVAEDGAGAHPLLRAQRTFGNQAVQGMVRTGFAAQSPALQRASELDSQTTETERKQIQSLGNEKVGEISPAELKSHMTGKDKTSISGLEKTSFGSGIDAKIQPGLLNIAGTIFGDAFRPNSVTNLALDLSKYGGVNGVYRFALIQRKTAPKLQLVIEVVSSSPPANVAKTDLVKGQARFDKFGFKLGSGFATDVKKRQLFSALDRIPDAILARVPGVTFILDLRSTGDHKEAGHYDPNIHAVHLFAASLETLQNTSDPLGANLFTYTIAHEMGHALDYEAYTEKRIKRDRLAKELKDAQTEARRINMDTDLGLDAGDKAKQKEKADQAKIKQLQKDLDAAEKEFAKAQDDLDEEKGGAHTQSKKFKDASKGKAISTYGGTAPVEHFAELFSMYVLDPKLLQSLRPDAYNYFSAMFP